MTSDQTAVPGPGGPKATMPPPKGKAPPGAAAPGALPLPAAGADLPIRKILTWSRRIVGEAKGRFATSLGVSLLSQQLGQYSTQLFAFVIAGLVATSQGGDGSAARPDMGFLDFLLPSGLVEAAILFAVIAVVALTLQFAENTIAQWCDSAMVGKLQERLHDRLLCLGPGFHQKIGIAQTQQILAIYLRTAQTMFRHIIAYPVLYGIGFATAVIYLVNGLTILSRGELGPLPWVLLAAMVFMPIVSWRLAGRLRERFRAVTREEQELAVAFANSASRPLEIQLLNAGEQRRKAFAREVADVVRARFRAIIGNEVANQLQAATPRILEAVVLIVGIFMALKLPTPAERAAAAGALVVLVRFVPAAIAPIQQLIQFAMTVNNARPQLELVISVLEAEPEVKDPAAPKPLAPDCRDLALRGVAVAPRADGPPVLQGLDHAFAPGKVTAIVGRSGSGKSTLLVATARLRDVDGGRVTLGGLDLREISLADLHRNVAMLSQFPLFMDATVRDNLLLGRPDADDATLEAVCRAAGVWQALENNAAGGSALDGRLHMEANKGALSGGERRLLAFARLLLTDAPVVLLDEPTTGVDALTQKTLMDLVRERLAGRTVLLVDHDMDFVATVADEVCCLDGGRIVDVVAKADLFRRPSLFRELHEARRRAIGGGLTLTQPLQGGKGGFGDAPPPGPAKAGEGKAPAMMGVMDAAPGGPKKPPPA